MYAINGKLETESAGSNVARQLSYARKHGMYTAIEVLIKSRNGRFLRAVRVFCLELPF